MSTYLQTYRELAATIGGRRDLVLDRFSGTEAISELFHFDIEVLVPADAPLDFNAILGGPVSLRIGPAEESPRYVHGLVSRLSEGELTQVGADDVTLRRYRLELVPQLWLTTHHHRSRIFKRRTVPEIVLKVLDEHGIRPQRFLSGEYKRREYCVQYRESDFHFISRLLEEEGIHYHFTHTSSAHQMVLGDAPTAHRPVPDPATIEYEQQHGSERIFIPRIHRWEKTQVIRPATHKLRDHHFEPANINPDVSRPLVETVTIGKSTHRLKSAASQHLAIDDYPGEFAQRFDGVNPGGGDQAEEVAQLFDEGSRTVKLRAEAEAAAAVRVEGASHCPQLTAGHRFAFTRHGDGDGDYVVVRIEHRGHLGATSGTQSHHRNGNGSGSGNGNGNGQAREALPLYENTFTCLPATLPFRPERRTRCPRIHGTQTALVVGDDEITTDKYGRVQVKFHWDRAETPSRWVRVATNWAGTKWGGAAIPRVGQEVLVAFHEGNPDRPVIVGSLYNAANMPPFDFPDKRMVSGLRSNSYPGGGGSNEIQMDDTAGAEMMYLHAQKDRASIVGHDSSEQVVNNLQRSVGVDEKVEIGNNLDRSIGVNVTEKVGSNQTLNVGSNQTISVGSNKTETVAIASAETVGAAKALSVGAAYAITVGGAMNTAVGLSSTEQVGIYKSVIVGSKLEIRCGASRIVMESGGKITIEGTEFLFSASGDVKINGAVIDLN